MKIRALLAAGILVAGALPLAARESAYKMRLRVKPGTVLRYKLSIDQKSPPSRSALVSTVRIEPGAGSALNFSCTFDSLSIQGMDRTPELKAACRDQTAVLPWTDLSRRTGQRTGFNINPGKEDVNACLMEAGIYMPYFLERPVKAGESWPGSTTATGGCTGGKFTFKKAIKYKDRTIYDFEVTNIAFLKGEKQLGPMTMTVQGDTGLPVRVEYSVLDTKGAKRHFVQQLLSEQRTSK